MLDVHAPEHPISGVREFLLHLFTITCGLLIALALENAAEAWHHRQERKETEALIREELTESRKELLDAGAGLGREIQGMQALLAFATARSLDQPASLPVGAMGFREGDIPDSAWLTASSTGALQWLPFVEVQRFAGAYKEQALLQSTAVQALNDYLQLGAFLPIQAPSTFTLSPELAKQSLPLIRQTLAHLQGMRAIGVGTLGSYQNALQ